MSTDYVSLEPLSLDEAIRRSGWTVRKWVENPGPDGAYRVTLTDGTNHIHCASGVDGHLLATRYGPNDVGEFVNRCGLIAEHLLDGFDEQERLELLGRESGLDPDVCVGYAAHRRRPEATS